MSKLFAGPFVGEFGHELFCWQGVLRNLATSYDYVTVACMTGKDILYKDFADEIITYNPQKYIPNGPYNYGQTDEFPVPTYDCDYIGPNTQLTEYHGSRNGIFEPNLKQTFFKYGLQDSNETTYDYIIHARSTNKVNTGFRNWSIDKWVELCNNLEGKIASIGTEAGAYHIEGTNDLRGMSLERLCTILHKSGVIIGPSSGPMHLASLCGLPQVVWSGDWYNKKRYEKDWNPHNTKVNYLKTNTWDISVEEVLSCLR